jgi:septal ring factor EnvC (AmiA/AmiB activator)
LFIFNICLIEKHTKVLEYKSTQVATFNKISYTPSIKSKRKQKMSKTLSPLQVELASARASLKFFKSEVSYLAAKVKVEAEAAKAEKIAAAEAKRAAAIVKAEARLAKLLAKSVVTGSKAVKANKRPSKGVVFGAEANDLAAKIKAGVSTI